MDSSSSNKEHKKIEENLESQQQPSGENDGKKSSSSGLDLNISDDESNSDDQEPEVRVLSLYVSHLFLFFLLRCRSTSKMLSIMPPQNDDEDGKAKKLLLHKEESLKDDTFLSISLGNVNLPTSEELNWALAELDIKHEELEKQIKENFYANDSDGSGSIDREELGDLLVHVSQLLAPGTDVPTKEDMKHAIDQAMHDLDADGNGTLDINEFSLLVKMYVVLSANMGESGRPLTPSSETLRKRTEIERKKKEQAKHALDLELKHFGFTRKMVRNHIRESFFAWDKDGNGTIDREELGPLLLALMKQLAPGMPNPSPKELSRVVDAEMEELDEDGNGVLERNEFAVLVKRFLVKMHRQNTKNSINGSKVSSRPPTSRASSRPTSSRGSSHPTSRKQLRLTSPKSEKNGTKA
mmetsp:Transcript_36790/g.58974  ORF Transcript_36790/g.58974 Transcript_36790/m.58974 type:complete len:410 (+) Transcript_36790:72-1301(+)